MRKKLIIMTAVGVLSFAPIYTSTQATSQKPEKPPVTPGPPIDQSKLKSPPRSGASFAISPIDGVGGMFSILLADQAGKTVSGTFSLHQIEIFEAVLEAAKTFAFTDEKVGSSSPITTRLMDQHEWSLFVDVSKVGKKSMFFISLATPQGKLTAGAGEITRDSKTEPSALFLEVIEKVHEAKVAAKPLQ